MAIWGREGRTAPGPVGLRSDPRLDVLRPGYRILHSGTLPGKPPCRLRPQETATWGFGGRGGASSPSASSERQPRGPPSREGRVWEKGGCRIRGDQEGRWNRVARAAGACRGGKAPHKSSRGWGVGRGPPSAPGSAEGRTGSRTEPLGSRPLGSRPARGHSR